MKTLLFFCCSSGIQSGTRFAAWGANQACKIYLQAVYLDNLTFLFPGNAVVDLIFSPLFVFLAFLDVFTIAVFTSRFCTLSSINARLTGRRYGDIMIIYIAVSGSFCRACSAQLAPIWGAVPEQWRKYVLFWACCTTALFGFLTAV